MTWLEVLVKRHKPYMYGCRVSGILIHSHPAGVLLFYQVKGVKVHLWHLTPGNTFQPEVSEHSGAGDLSSRMSLNLLDLCLGKVIRRQLVCM